MSSHTRKAVTCPDCGAVGLPVRVPQYDRPGQPHVVRCLDCMAAIDVAPTPTVSQIEAVTGVTAVTLRAARGLEAFTLERVERSVTVEGAEQITIARDRHGAVIVRHSARGTFRAATLRDALAALDGDIISRPTTLCAGSGV